MRHFHFKASMCAVAVALAACQALPDDGALMVSPALVDADRRVAAVPSAFTKSQIDHLRIELYRLSGNTEALVGSNTVSGAQITDSKLSFGNLRRNTTYRVRATAYSSSNDSVIISEPDQSATDVAVLTDPAPVLAKVPVKLRNTVFEGTASGGFIITDGATTSEAMAVMRGLTLAGSAASLGANPNGGYADDPTGTSANSTALFASPSALVMGKDGKLYVADSGNRCIRTVTTAGAVTTLIANLADASSASTPTSLALEPSGSLMVHSSVRQQTSSFSYGNLDTISRVQMNGTSSTIVSTQSTLMPGLPGTPCDLMMPGCPPSGFMGGTPSYTQYSAKISQPKGLAVDGTGKLYFTQLNQISTLDGSNAPQPYSGGAAGLTNDVVASALFRNPTGLAFAGTTLYVADTDNNVIRKIAGGTVTTFAGSSVAGLKDDTGTSAQFDHPRGLAVDAAGNVYVADTNNHCIRKITTAGVVTTVAGMGTAGAADAADPRSMTFNSPQGVAVDAAGNLYVADTGNHMIRVIR